MSKARIVHTWPDGTKMDLTIDVDTSYPDALDEARCQVTRMYRETCDVGQDAEGDND